ncbi:esterase-like activity of phytase family protein [Mycolicibacterium sp. 22603]|uniref:esterase-like activity of phytase family protein n=1 Tax=Mycolicibacterium sp. 22603 TaxID=3453950 RepID=UPI003F825E1F
MPTSGLFRATALVAAAVVFVAACCTDSEHGNHGRPGPQTQRATSTINFALAESERFHRLATYPVYLNRPAGTDPGVETAAEISTASADGNTVVYTDAAAGRIGFVDISDPLKPVGKGSLSLQELGGADDRPTSVTAVGEFVLVAIDGTGADLTNPSGRLDVIRIADRTRVRSIDLGGQPDSIALSPDGTFAAIAVENQRDERSTPPGGDEGDLPQAPTGFVQVVTLAGGPGQWRTRRVDVDIERARAAGLDTPEDLEPEYVSINARGQVAVTLQENNGIAIIDGNTGALSSIFSAGTQAVEGIDTHEDGTLDQSGSIAAAPREPDAIGWIGDGHVATANEGDWKGGTRGWTVFDATTGDVTWDSGNSLEKIAVRTGMHVESRAGSRGPEPEGLISTEIGGRPMVLVASERSNFVAGYDVSDPQTPVFRQILPTTAGPEGILAIPSRNLLVVSSEADDADHGVRSAITIFGYGGAFAGIDAGRPLFPSIVSGDLDGAPIGWGALGALAADPAAADRLFTATDRAYGPARVLSIDLAKTPALIDSELPITENGTPASLDIEGLIVRPDGYVLAVEGRDGGGNELVNVAPDGAIKDHVRLPDEIAAGLAGQGLEGVAIDGETIWVALQREIDGDPPGVVRLGRYTPANQQWEWFGYRLEASESRGDRMSLSEIVVHDGALLVLERDNRTGPEARVKAIYRVGLPTGPGVADGAEPPVLPKTLARDLLPDLAATKGFVQEKVEGFAIAGNGNLYVVTDNDGAEDTTGETVLLNLGPAREALG